MNNRDSTDRYRGMALQSLSQENMYCYNLSKLVSAALPISI